MFDSRLKTLMLSNAAVDYNLLVFWPVQATELGVKCIILELAKLTKQACKMPMWQDEATEEITGMRV